MPGQQLGGPTLAIDAFGNRAYHAGAPEIARFLGIVIGIFPREHPPAHFHAVYGEYAIAVEIEGGIVHGDFPKRALRLVLEWLGYRPDEPYGGPLHRLSVGQAQQQVLAEVLSGQEGSFLGARGAEAA